MRAQGGAAMLSYALLDKRSAALGQQDRLSPDNGDLLEASGC